MRHTLPLALLASLFVATPAFCQVAPERDDNWATVSTVSLVIGAGTEILMPRIFYSDPEATVGWKARWHVSVLAPSMTLMGMSLLNEYWLKDEFEGYRPGCDENNQGGPGCRTYGMMSTHSFAAFSALGQGGAVFLFDMTKWSHGKFNAGSLVGHVVVPALSATLTAIARDTSDWEKPSQVWLGAGAGVASGFLMGMTYALMQRPECGYTGSLICW